MCTKIYFLYASKINFPDREESIYELLNLVLLAHQVSEIEI